MWAWVWKPKKAFHTFFCINCRVREGDNGRPQQLSWLDKLPVVKDKDKIAHWQQFRNSYIKYEFVHEKEHKSVWMYLKHCFVLISIKA